MSHEKTHADISQKQMAMKEKQLEIVYKKKIKKKEIVYRHFLCVCVIKV